MGILFQNKSVWEARVEFPSKIKLVIDCTTTAKKNKFKEIFAYKNKSKTKRNNTHKFKDFILFLFL